MRRRPMLRMAAPQRKRDDGSPHALQAALLTAAPSVLLVAIGLLERTDEATSLRVALAGVAAATTAMGGALVGRLPRTGRALGSLGIASVPPLVPEVLAAPALVLITLVVLAVGGLSLWSPSAMRGAEGLLGPSRAVRGSAYLSLATWALAVPAELSRSPLALGATALALGVTAFYAGLWIRRAWHPVAIRARILFGAGVVTVALALPFLDAPAGLLGAAGFLPIAALLTVPASHQAIEGAGWILEHPGRLLVVTFALLVLVGTGLLALPGASATGTSVGLMDAAFTAVSAVCVTGLIVLDTPHAFSPFGQALLLVLIQIGALGIMTFYSAAFAAFGRRLSLRHERALAGALSVRDRGRLQRSIRRVLLVTGVSEALGTLALWPLFALHGDSALQAFWRALFTSVSAFCNAGFALQTESLVPYQHQPLVLHVVALLIVIGGLSPAVVGLLPSVLRRQPVSLQVRLVLLVTAGLLAAGTIAFALFEWTHALDHLPVADRLHNAWFQSVTLRTAGFNSIALGDTQPATQTMMIAMMFIGGSPGGTAGGIKTTTLAILALAVASAIERRPQTAVFGRHVGHGSVYKAAAIVSLGVLTAIGGLMAIQLTQTMPLNQAVFEVVSALGTVGLSLGATAGLDGVGKAIIMACMFAGRLGPLTLFFFLAEQRPPPRWTYPTEEIDVG